MDKEKKFLLRIEQDVFKDIEKESKDANIYINKMMNFKLKGLELTRKK